MSVLHALYGTFVTRRVGGFLLLIVDSVLFFGSIAASALIRKFAFGSYEQGADVLSGFLIGLMLVAIFNSLVYFGAFGYRRRG